MPKKADGIANILKGRGGPPICVYGTGLERGDEVVITSNTYILKGTIFQVNRAGTVGRVNVGTRLKEEPYEVEEDDQTVDDDLAAITITITGTPGSATGSAIIDP